jgi:hypothetical protein
MQLSNWKYLPRFATLAQGVDIKLDKYAEKSKILSLSRPELPYGLKVAASSDQPTLEGKFDFGVVERRGL